MMSPIIGHSAHLRSRQTFFLLQCGSEMQSEVISAPLHSTPLSSDAPPPPFLFHTPPTPAFGPLAPGVQPFSEEDYGSFTLRLSGMSAMTLSQASQCEQTEPVDLSVKRLPESSPVQNLVPET